MIKRLAGWVAVAFLVLGSVAGCGGRDETIRIDEDAQRSLEEREPVDSPHQEMRQFMMEEMRRREQEQQ